MDKQYENITSFETFLRTFILKMSSVINNNDNLKLQLNAKFLFHEALLTYYCQPIIYCGHTQTLHTETAEWILLLLDLRSRWMMGTMAWLWR